MGAMSKECRDGLDFWFPPIGCSIPRRHRASTTRGPPPEIARFEIRQYGSHLPTERGGEA